MLTRQIILKIPLIPSSKSSSRHLRSPRLLNVINSLQQIPNKNTRILGRWKMPQSLHRSMHPARDLITSLLRHCRSVGPIVLAGQHVYWTGFGVDSCHAGTAVPACLGMLVCIMQSDGVCSSETHLRSKSPSRRGRFRRLGRSRGAR